VVPGPPYPHYDVDGHWVFLLDALRRFHQDHGIDGISVTTHGATAALLAEDGTLATPILDYEFDGPSSVAAEYDSLRPPFSETGSPRLAGGLNVGAQLHWLFANDPTLHARAARIVTYPQYWGHRLTGVAATDVTSIGCHTDLWNPQDARFSSLVDTLDIRDKIAPARQSAERLGTILPEFASRTGLPPETPVLCGIHDSNASLFPHVMSRQAPFCVVSTGTWVIAMSIGGRSRSLDPDRDTLINVNALGQPVPSARFMGGREYEVISQGQSSAITSTDATRVLDDGLMLLPAVEPRTGPFQGMPMRWHPAEPSIGSADRAVALSWYLALVTAECLDIIGAEGPVIVEGPFTRNRQYIDMLHAATGRPVTTSDSATGTSVGAALLFDPAGYQSCDAAPVEDPVDALCHYAAAWRERANRSA
jgi:sugar (pentulose or hexulose) kinase